MLTYQLKGCDSCAVPSGALARRRPEFLWSRPPDVAHIVEEPNGLEQLAEVDTPTEEYYDALRKDMVPCSQRKALDQGRPAVTRQSEPSS